MSGYVTTHVLDTSLGTPAQGVKVELFIIENKRKQLVNFVISNKDGRSDLHILDKDSFKLGVYEMQFDVRMYFDSLSENKLRNNFFDIIPIRFLVREDTHYHIPLLLSPFGYSTYRGS
jgi:5-hydroxyisourate hydrolase